MDNLTIAVFTKENEDGDVAILQAKTEARYFLKRYDRSEVVSVTSQLTTSTNIDRVVWTRFTITVVVVEKPDDRLL